MALLVAGVLPTVFPGPAELRVDELPSSSTSSAAAAAVCRETASASPWETCECFYNVRAPVPMPFVLLLDRPEEQPETSRDHDASSSGLRSGDVAE